MILSFDIGIRNLAYCFLNEDSCIKGWGILNLTEDGETQGKCCYEFITGKNKGKVCDKKGISYKEESFFCKRHTLEEHKKIKKPKKVKDISILELSLNLVKVLDLHLNPLVEKLKPEVILIELQPRFNPKMKNLSMMLYNYFIIRKMIDSPILSNIKFISAKKKLSIYDGPFVPCNLKDKYSRTKYLGVKYTEYIIRDDTENLNLLNSHKKKDDLCDCFMQGAWYLKFNKLR